MRYVSTRGQTEPLTFTEAVATGLAPDGGLYVPETLPDIQPLLKQWEGLNYPELCLEFFKLFATDLDESTLTACVEDAYSRFDHEEIAPLVRLDERLHLLELFHGPTLAFKDFALQLLGNLYEAHPGTPARRQSTAFWGRKGSISSSCIQMVEFQPCRKGK
jgi:threonine synthase